ncbi:MAG: helix-turn-helix domain-containing protein [Lachnospiraceae bacterium]
MKTDSDAFDRAYQKGYLNHDLELFYIQTDCALDFPYHYHDFYKLLIHIQGEVTYRIEGCEYPLLPYDTLLIRPGEIHRPEADTPVTYERIIAYISESFFTSLETYGCSLKDCFDHPIIRFSSPCPDFIAVINAIKSCYSAPIFGSALLKRIKLQEYLILLNQRLLKPEQMQAVPVSSNEKVKQILTYVNQHLCEDLSIETIANALYLHPSYLMHLFKKETGYTIGKYISEKRLFLANQLIASGKTMTEACYMSGYQNYSTFYLAYKSRYGHSPRGK